MSDRQSSISKALLAAVVLSGVSSNTVSSYGCKPKPMKPSNQHEAIIEQPMMCSTQINERSEE